MWTVMIVLRAEGNKKAADRWTMEEQRIDEMLEEVDTERL